MELRDYLNSINYEKKHVMEDSRDEKEYYPFMVNRCMSYFPDSILQANQMNTSWHLPKRMQYDYLFHGLRSRKRFSKWEKINHPKEIDLIKRYFGYSTQKALDILPILTEDDISAMYKGLNKGG